MSSKPNSVYKILYRNKGEDSNTTPHFEVVELPTIRALAKYLNRFTNNGERRVLIVWLSNSKFEYVKIVQFLPKEIKEQKFITGKKKRLLAWAKYKCQYDVAVDF